MNVYKRALTSVLAGIAVAFAVTACNGSSSTAATNGVTEAWVNQQIAKAVAAATAPLQAEINNLKGLKLTVSHAQGATALVAGLTRSTTSTCSWTLSSVNLNTGLLHVITCDGYYMTVTEAGSGDYSYEQPITSGQIAFDGQGCTGNMYVTGNSGVSVGLVQSGLLFTLNPQNPQGMGNADYSNAAYYWKLPAAEGVSTFTQASFWQYGAGCETSVATLQGYLVQQDNGSGPDAPVPGPVLPASLP